MPRLPRTPGSARAGRPGVRGGWRGASAVSLVALVLGAACGTAASAPGGGESTPPGVLRTGDATCLTEDLHIPADAPSEFVVEHQGDQPVVVTIPRQAISVLVAPGQREVVPLNPHVVGNFDYYCIDEATHLALGGHEGIGITACPLDPGSLVADGSSRGVLRLEQHATP